MVLSSHRGEGRAGGSERGREVGRGDAKSVVVVVLVVVGKEGDQGARVWGWSGGWGRLADAHLPQEQ